MHVLMAMIAPVILFGKMPRVTTATPANSANFRKLRTILGICAPYRPVYSLFGCHIPDIQAEERTRWPWRARMLAGI